MPLSQNPDAGDAATFEAALAELQQVVAQLEDGDLDLESALRLFERGTELASRCQRLVDEAELRVTRLRAEPASPLEG
jgi:exodeoxyribonuclease VII small subunit